MKEIQLTQGQVALVDDDIFEELNQFKWCVVKDRKIFYAHRQLPTVNGKRCKIKMHHAIIGKPPKGYETDHKNGQGLDNQRHNLRHVTHRENCQNRKNQESSSQYPGIYWKKDEKKWIAQIQINGKSNSLGCFVDELEAFKIYKQAVEALGEKIIEDF